MSAISGLSGFIKKKVLETGIFLQLGKARLPPRAETWWIFF